jgi:signal transduction histidine kinase
VEVAGDVTLWADQRKLKQVLINLLQNALEASPAGSTVTLAVREEGRDVVFEVRDEGEGIDPVVADRLFVVGATTKPTGSGLGLVIARGIAEQHGGSLELRARTDRSGCVARLTVPHTIAPARGGT